MYKILVVEDNRENCELIAEILRNIAVCEFAANGTDAIAAYNQGIQQKKPYDLIFLDLELPQISGLQVLERIRESENKAGIHLSIS